MRWKCTDGSDRGAFHRCRERHDADVAAWDLNAGLDFMGAALRLKKGGDLCVRYRIQVPQNRNRRGGVKLSAKAKQ